MDPVTEIDHESFSYNASSPDELALVNGARFLGVTFLGRDEGQLDSSDTFNIDFKGKKRSYTLLNTIEFSSARKRMTSVFRDLSNGQIIVMCKGADSALLPLLRDKESAQVRSLTDKSVAFMNDFAKEGLRTLLIVEKTMSEAEYARWSASYSAAVSSMVDRDARVE